MAKTDKRIIKTRKSLYDAFVSLLGEKNNYDISISELTNRAGIARQTFYLNFNNKEDIILWKGIQLYDLYREEVPRVNSEKDRLELLIDHFRSNKSFYKIVQKTNQENNIYKLFQETLFSMKAGQSIVGFYHNLYHAAGIWNCLYYWSINEFDDSEEDVLQVLDYMAVS